MHLQPGGRTRAGLLAAAAAVALLAGACSGDDTQTLTGSGTGGTSPVGGSPATGSAGTTAPPSTVEGELPSTSVGPAAGPPPDGTTAGACPALAPVPAGADTDSDRGDFDGDRALDSVTAYRVGGQWKLRVGLTTGGGAEVDVPGVTGEAGLTPLGGANLGGGPGSELFAVVGQGAATASIGVFRLEGCALSRVLGPTGAPSEFPVGGTVVHGSGLRCEQVGDQVRLLVLEATSADGTAFTGTAQPLLLQGDRLVGGGEVASASLTAPADNGPLSEYFRITCGGVAEGS